MQNSLGKLALSIVMKNEEKKTWIFCNWIFHIWEVYVAKIPIGNSKCNAEWRQIRRTFPILPENRSMCSLSLFVGTRYSNIFFYIWMWRLFNLRFFFSRGTSELLLTIIVKVIKVQYIMKLLHCNCHITSMRIKITRNEKNSMNFGSI